MSYRVDKNFLNPRDINAIKNDCFVEGRENQYGPAQKLRAYGETQNAIYIPFSYAKSRFQNSPNKELIFPRTNYIFYHDKYPFRTDRDQEEVYNEAIDLLKKHRSTLLSLHCGFGKCLGKGTPILLYDGKIKNVENIKIGDTLMGDDSTPRNVLSLSRGQEEMYDVIQTIGDTYTVNKSHILSLYISHNKQIIKLTKQKKQIGFSVKWFDHNSYILHTTHFYSSHHNNNLHNCYKTATKFVQNIDSPNIIDISVNNYLNLSKSLQKILLGYKVPIIFPEKLVPIDPYILGYWLGIGSFPNNNTKFELNNFWNSIHSYKLTENKYIPYEYKTNSTQIRLKVLAGIFDSCGQTQNNNFILKQQSKLLSNDILYICRSIGLSGYIKINDDNNYTLTISGNLDIISTKLKIFYQNKNYITYRIKLVKRNIDDYYGFTIDGNNRFLLGDFTVTHNTYEAIRIAQACRLKCGILAHRSILFDQWIDSFTKFTNAKGQMVGTDGILDPNADYYIFNIAYVHKKWNKKLQSWTPKKLGIYKNQIGLLIVDEAHMACATEMSRALLYFNPRLMLGLTATPIRKDGMDKVLELYFGEYEKTQIIRKATDPFTVYRLPTEIKPIFTRNSFGKKDWNSVINSLVENETRNKLIIDLIIKFHEFNIIVLTKRKNHCNLLSKMLDDAQITNTVMVGTTKTYDNTARVLLSTYSKLGVGFDDTRLNMLIVACSVTEVEQYAGRLRDAVGKKRVIIDLVDNDSNCLSHWQERRKWYISRNGTIKNYYKVFPKQDEKNSDIDEKNEPKKRLARRL